MNATIRKRAGVGATIAFAAAGLLISPSPVAASAVCPPPGPLEQIIAVDATELGPLTVQFRPIYGVYTESAAACWPGVDIDVTAFIGRPEGIGGVQFYAIEPAWLVERGHFLSVSDETDPDTGWIGPFLPVAVPPELESRFLSLEGQWARVTGHFSDRLAKTCAVTESSPEAEDVPTPAQAVEICRASFVISALAPLHPPNTDTAPLVDSAGRVAGWPSLLVGIAALVAFAGFYRRFARVDRGGRRCSRAI